MGTRSAVSEFFLDIRGCAIFVGEGIQYQRSSHNPLVSLNFGNIPAVVLIDRCSAWFIHVLFS